MVSKKCDQCWAVKRCRAYPNAQQDAIGRLIYLCGPCARLLGYAPTMKGQES